MSQHKQWPLEWPHGVERTKKPQKSAFRVTPDTAQGNLYRELRLLGARNIVVSSNSPLRNDGRAMAIARGRPQPLHPGVVVYFALNGKPKFEKCDHWNAVCDNMQAIAKTIEAKRAIERYKASSMDDMVRDVPLLPGPGGTTNTETPETWHSVLQVSPQAELAVIEVTYRKLAKAAAENENRLKQLNLAVEEARQVVKERGK